MLPGVDLSAPEGAGQHGKELVVCQHVGLAEDAELERLIDRLGVCFPAVVALAGPSVELGVAAVERD